MSQLSLLMQLKLQRKLQKSQSQLLISESLDSLGEEDGEELGLADDETVSSRTAEGISSLALLHFFYLHFNQVRGETSARFYARRHKLVESFFPKAPDRETFPLFPTYNLVSAYPLAVVCECGNILNKENFGVVFHCLSCYGLGRRPTYWPGHLTGDVDLAHVPRAWHDWAQSVAIQFETTRKSNQNRVTDFGEIT